MRNLSFALTEQAVRNRTKTVTRRRGTFWFEVLEEGALLSGVRKSQGLRPGEQIERLAVVRVLDLRVLSVDAELNGDGYETVREGFPHLSWPEFVAMFCKHMKCTPHDVVTRIEFEYVEQRPSRDFCGVNCTSKACVYESAELHRIGTCRCSCHEWSVFARRSRAGAR